ncbi:MAG: AraC family transcriptional regulator [Akkermansiaceae bacterium]
MKLVLENVQTQPGSSFAWQAYDLPHFDHHYHHHPEIEITWILESEGQRLIGDSLEAFGPGDLVMIGSHLPHQYRNWKSGRACSRVIQFDHLRFGRDFFGLPEFSRIRQLLIDSARGICFSDATRLAAQRQMAALFASESSPAQVLALLGLLNLLSEDPEPRKIASSTYTKPVNLKQINRLQRVLNYLEIHWQETVTLADVAKVAALHPQSISRFLRQHLGMNYQEYLIQLRIGRAARLLLESDRTVMNIALDCGYNNLANFNRHFHAAYGKTPSVYRKHD